MNLVQVIPLAVFAFGALAFSVLAFSYWRQRRRLDLFGLFTLVCAAVFVLNLTAGLPFLDLPALDYARRVLAGILPPMTLHLVLQREQAAGGWKVLLWGLYVSALVDELDALPLGASAVAAIAILLLSRRERRAAELRHRILNIVIFAAMGIAAAGSVWAETPVFDLLPDYLLLSFFAVWLYYSERLAFFDVFLKGGLYFATGAVLMALLVATVDMPGSAALAITALWLLGPPLHRWIVRWIDHGALRRRYSQEEAERVFLLAIQSSATEKDLEEAAVQSLSEIFSCRVALNLSGKAISAEPGDLVEGCVGLRFRENELPFLSDDHRLLKSLATTLEVVTENVRFRVRQQELAAHATRAELRALRAQINPHFLFNALNAIAGWIRVRPDVADDTVAQLAEVFRYALNRSDQEWVRLEEELDFVRAYLAVERARFGDRLEVGIACEAGVESVFIPAMLIQPLVENAIKHGTSQLVGVGKLQVSVSGSGAMVRVVVSDNGGGFVSDSGREGLGLRNISDRLRGYYGSQGTLRWQNLNCGCEVILELPRERDWK